MGAILSTLRETPLNGCFLAYQARVRRCFRRATSRKSKKRVLKDGPSSETGSQFGKGAEICR